MLGERTREVALDPGASADRPDGEGQAGGQARDARGEPFMSGPATDQVMPFVDINAETSGNLIQCAKLFELTIWYAEPDGEKHMSTDPQATEKSKPGRSDARAAVYGLLGAIIGGLATFGGAYWTGHQTQSETQSTSERSAYVAFGEAAGQYANNLIQLKFAYENHDNQSYAQIRANLAAEVGPLYGDVTG